MARAPSFREIKATHRRQLGYYTGFASRVKYLPGAYLRSHRKASYKPIIGIAVSFKIKEKRPVPACWYGPKKCLPLGYEEEVVSVGEVGDCLFGAAHDARR